MSAISSRSSDLIVQTTDLMCRTYFSAPLRIPGNRRAMSHLDALSYTNALKLSRDELPELLQGF
jgi:hypothetical protein